MDKPRHELESEFYNGLTTPIVEGPARPSTKNGMHARKRALREGRLIPRHEAARLDAEAKATAAAEAAQEAAEAAQIEPPAPEVEPEPEPTQDQEDELAAQAAEEEGEQPSGDDGADLLE